MKKVEAGPLWPTPVLYVEDEVLNWEVVELRLGQRFALKWAKSADEACAGITCQPGQKPVCASSACACAATEQKEIACTDASQCTADCPAAYQIACVEGRCACQR